MIPFHKARPKEADSLLLIDIEAVMVGISQIANCLYHQKRADEIDIFLERCENIIRDPRYIFNIQSLRALWHFNLGNTGLAKELLRKTSYENVELIAGTTGGRKGLGFALELLLPELPLALELEILQALLGTAEENIEKVDLLCLKALIHYLTTVRLAIFE